MADKNKRVISKFTDNQFALIVFALAILSAIIYVAFSPEIKYEIDPEVAARRVNITKIKPNTKPKNTTSKVAAKPAIDISKIKYQKIVINGNGMNLSRKPDFVCNTEKSIHNFNQKYKWTGKNDLSMDIWLGLDASGLNITADILDDHYYNENIDSNSIYKFDSIQLAFYFDNIKEYNSPWELGFASGKDWHQRHCWIMPSAYKSEANAFLKSILYGIEPIPGGFRHRIVIPYNNAIKFTRYNIRNGIRFNLIYNDADDKKSGRRNIVEIAPGIGENKIAAYFPLISFKE